MRLRPGLIILAGFLSAIVIGAILLMLPVSSKSGTFTNLIDAFFVSNSAACTTALTPLDIGSHFSLFGLVVIMTLMQIGGIGYMLLSTLLMVLFRKNMFISEKLMIQETLHIYSPKDSFSLLRKIIIIAGTIEGAGAAILFLRWLPELGTKKSLLYAAFHSISAFCNAGLTLPAHFASLTAYRGDAIINLTMAVLAILGGLGFLVIADIFQNKRFSLQSKIVIWTSAWLLVIGTLLILGIEFYNGQTIGHLSFGDKFLTSFFHSVSARSAGFHTLAIGNMLRPTALVIIFLMFIGASTGGCGGGIKTTTFAVILATIFSTLKNKKNTIMFERRIPPEIVRRAFAIFFLMFAIVIAGIISLNITEEFSIFELSFEAFSAMANVGFSFGITPLLTNSGKITIIAITFLGKAGILSMLMGLSGEHSRSVIEYPKEGISIG